MRDPDPQLFDRALDIPGLRYIPDFIGPELEGRLVARIDAGVWNTSLKRRVQHYGYRYDYKARRVRKDDRLGPLPLWIGALTKRLVRMRVFRSPPDQVIVNEYLPGQGVAPHIDCVPCFGDVVASLSLASGCVMDFSRPKPRRKASMYLEPRSLIILADEARRQGRHSIPPRRSDVLGDVRKPRQRRLLLTFRTVRLEKAR